MFSLTLPTPAPQSRALVTALLLWPPLCFVLSSDHCFGWAVAGGMLLNRGKTLRRKDLDPSESIRGNVPSPNPVGRWWEYQVLWGKVRSESGRRLRNEREWDVTYLPKLRSRLLLLHLPSKKLLSLCLELDESLSLSVSTFWVVEDWWEERIEEEPFSHHLTSGSSYIESTFPLLFSILFLEPAYLTFFDACCVSSTHWVFQFQAVLPSSESSAESWLELAPVVKWIYSHISSR